jgi:probable HAF family extracellular repeat protein
MTLVPPSRARRGLGLLTIGVVGLLLAAPAAPAAADPAALHVVDLGTLAGACCSSAASINDRGDVVGSSTADANGFTSHAFLWRKGRMTDLGTLGGNYSAATDINNRGDVVGDSELYPGGPRHAFLWRDGRMRDLGTLGGGTSFATAINNRGEVVGLTGEGRAFLWRDGTMTDLGTLNGSGYARARDINDRGQVVGGSTLDGMNTLAVLWYRGTVRTLADFPAEAMAVNDHGQVVGIRFGNPAFLWSQGRIVDITPPPGAMFIEALGINNRGQVVGHTDSVAFVWQDGHLTPLPGLVRQGRANHINNRGQIVGESATSVEGFNPHAVLWTR